MTKEEKELLKKAIVEARAYNPKITYRVIKYLLIGIREAIEDSQKWKTI